MRNNCNDYTRTQFFLKKEDLMNIKLLYLLKNSKSFLFFIYLFNHQ